MQRIISRAHQGLAWTVLVGLLLQFYLTGLAILGAESFKPHRLLGSSLMVPVILLAILALVGRLERRLIGLSLLLVVLTVVQIMLPSLRANTAWVAALHPVNALALIRISLTIGRNSRAGILQVS